MPRFLFLVLLGLLGFGVGTGCARVQVEAPKEAIKLDITMRLDVYQHVTKDIDAIEDFVNGEDAKPKAPGNQSFFQNFFVSDAYADEEIDPAVKEAALRRKERHSELVSLQTQGIIGENKSGLVEVRDTSKAGNAGSLVSAENNDRMVIYKGIAAKNGSSVSDVQKLYAQRLQSDAAAGTPIETSSGWKIK